MASEDNLITLGFALPKEKYDGCQALVTLLARLFGGIRLLVRKFSVR